MFESHLPHHTQRKSKMSKYEVNMRIKRGEASDYVRTTIDTNSGPSSAGKIAQSQYNGNKSNIVSVRKIG